MKPPSFLKILIVTLFSTIVSLLLTPILLSVSLIIILIRFLLSVYLKIKYANKVKLIGSMDSFQVYDKPCNLLETCTLIVLEGECDLDKVRKNISTKVINNEQDLYEKFRSKVVKKCGFYCWEDLEDKFVLEEHVKLIDPFNNNSTLFTEAKVLEKLSEFYSGNGMSIDKPRWEILLVPNYQPENKKTDKKPHYAFIFHAHHSVIDGISTYLLVSKVIGDQGNKFFDTVIDPLKPLNIPFYHTLFQYLKLFTLWPKLIYENLAEISKPEENSFHGPDLISKKIIKWTNTFRIETLRNIRRGQFSTNAVLNAAVGGAFKRLAEIKGVPVPDKITAVTSIPMLPYPNLKPQNRFSGAFFPLYVNGSINEEKNKNVKKKQMNRMDRIKCTDKTLKDIMKSPLIIMNSLLLRFIGILPAKWSQNMTDSRELTCLTSNVPGPLGSVFMFGGNKMVDVAGFLPIKNKTGFGFCFVSYCGNFRGTLIADGGIATEQDVEALRDALENEIKEMEKEAKAWQGEDAILLV